jgi:hypothetical protein
LQNLIHDGHYLRVVSEEKPIEMNVFFHKITQRLRHVGGQTL